MGEPTERDAPALLLDVLRDLNARLAKANAELVLRASRAGTYYSEFRLLGKANGVRLAMSYVDELIRVGEATNG